MNDRELLELAAKAAGYEYWDWCRSDGKLNVYDADDLQYVFDPLNDDGDAFRLAVKLNLAIILTGVAVNVSEIGGRSSIEPTGDDPCAATRRAIVRAAAEIGKNNE